MNNQIRVSPDRRGEVRVVFEAKTEMSDVLLAVDSFCHRTNRNVLNNIFFGTAANQFYHFLE